MTDQTPKPPIDWEGAKLSAEHGMRIPLNHLNNLGRAYLALRDEVERLRGMIAAAADVDPKQASYDNTITPRTSAAMRACELVLAEGRAIIAAREKEKP